MAASTARLAAALAALAVPALTPPLPAVPTASDVRAARGVVVTGTVRDEGNRPVPNAQVAAPARGTHGVSDAAGRYTLSVPDAVAGDTVVLVARRIGYAGATRSVVVRGDTVRADFVLRSATLLLEQTVVTDAVARQRAAGLPAAERRARADVAASPAAPANVSLYAPVATTAVRKAAGGSWPRVARRASAPADREQYDRIDDNPFLAVASNPRSTFSLDVDRASYANVRRFLMAGERPPADAVRIEELVNYFPYAVPGPRGDEALGITTEVAPAPWRPEHRLVRVAVQARRPDADERRPTNLVFLVDVSGSMQEPDKLPLVKRALGVPVDRLRPEDRVALVVYAGQAGLVLPSTPGSDRATIREAIDRLEAGGSTAGGAGLELAYRVAREHAGAGVNSRVVLATDGDFNVGPSSDAEMERLVEARRADGTYLTVVGFGTGNLQDAKMKKLAKRGNGNYAYVDDIAEARKVFGRELAGTLETVANDAKLQIEFNPAAVRAYRLIGYEGRLLRDEDFNDDAKDAGDVGAGHTVTAFYEVVPAGVASTAPVRGVDPLRYGPRGGPSDAPWTTNSAAPSDDRGTAVPREGPPNGAGDPRRDELLFVKLRYKVPGSPTSRLLSVAARDAGDGIRPSADFRFASAVAEWGMLLRQAPDRGNASTAAVLARARGALGDDPDGLRSAFVGLVERWRLLDDAVAARD